MWLTYSDLERPLRALLLEPDPRRRHGVVFEQFVADASALGMHGAIATMATTVGALCLMADPTNGGSAVDAIEVLSGMRAWNDTQGLVVNAVLDSWARGLHLRATSLVGTYLRHDGIESYVENLTERMVFAIYLAAVASAQPAAECAGAFLDGFFSEAR